MTTFIISLGFCVWGFLSPAETKISDVIISSPQGIFTTSIAGAPPLAKKQSFFQKIKTDL